MGVNQACSAVADLQMMLMSRFCNFQKQNRELSYASSVRASRSCQTKIYRWKCPDKWTKAICQGKFCKGRVEVF